MANCGLLLNDGTSFVLLNDGTSFLLLNDNSCSSEPGADLGAGGDLGHRGSLYWKRYQAELRRKKKKKTKKEILLQELDEYLVELEDRIEEAPPEEVEPAWKADLRRAQTFAYNELVTQQTAAEISVYVLLLREAIREMDDEEAIILAIH
jgi:hypothetical protein